MVMVMMTMMKKKKWEHTCISYIPGDDDSDGDGDDDDDEEEEVGTCIISTQYMSTYHKKRAKKIQRQKSYCMSNGVDKVLPLTSKGNEHFCTFLRDQARVDCPQPVVRKLDVVWLVRIHHTCHRRMNYNQVPKVIVFEQSHSRTHTTAGCSRVDPC